MPVVKCQVCNKKINDKVDYSIQCIAKTCRKWSHHACAKVQVKDLDETALTYRCAKCLTADNLTSKLAVCFNTVGVSHSDGSEFWGQQFQ